jgi:hypothetical protein
MADTWEDARQAWMRSERGEYGHDDERKILAAFKRGRKLEEALRELIQRTDVARAVLGEE